MVRSQITELWSPQTLSSEMVTKASALHAGELRTDVGTVEIVDRIDGEQGWDIDED